MTREVRDRLTRFIYVSQDPNDLNGPARGHACQVGRRRGAEKKLDRAVRGPDPRVHGKDWVGDAQLGNHLRDEARLLREVEA